MNKIFDETSFKLLAKTTEQITDEFRIIRGSIL